jgi:TatD DNase family protein
MPRLIDSHAHLQFAAYQSDYREVIARSLEANIWLVNVGTRLLTSQKAVELAEAFEAGVYAAVGLHPIHTEDSYPDPKEFDDQAAQLANKGEDFDFEAYKRLAEHRRVVAIGETGFDFYRQGEETKEKQAAAFEAQINLAAELKKPLMIHCRQAYPDLIKMLNARLALLSAPAGIVHFFSGTKEEARKLLDLGFYFSFGGVITFARDYDETIRYLGLDRILLETDAPYVAPVPFRGKRNEPAYLPYIAAALAEILAVTPEVVALKTTENAAKVLRI